MTKAMPKISLTDLVDIVSSAGVAKANKVKRIKNRPPYKPEYDYYKKFRNGVSSIHKKGEGKSALDDILAKVGGNKIAAYEELVKGYRKWWGRKSLEWIDIDKKVWSSRNIEVNINPELCFGANGITHIVKLYMKTDPLSKKKVDLVSHLLWEYYEKDYGKNAKMGVLDVRRGKFIGLDAPIMGMGDVLNAEMAYLDSLWNTV